MSNHRRVTMKKLIAIAALAAMPAMSATIIYSDGTQVEIPDDWKVKVVMKSPPQQCPPAPPPHACPPTPPACPSLCELDPGNDKCKRQRDHFTGQ